MATVSSTPPKPAVKPASSRSSVSKSSTVKKPSSAPKPKQAAKTDSVSISPKAPAATQTGNLTHGLQNNFGQRPDSQFRTHTVKPGESLSKLARAGLTNEENRPNGRQIQQGADIISALNRDGLKDPNKLTPGQQLTVPTDFGRAATFDNLARNLENRPATRALIETVESKGGIGDMIGQGQNVNTNFNEFTAATGRPHLIMNEAKQDGGEFFDFTSRNLDNGRKIRAGSGIPGLDIQE